ncbi:MAG: erythromycin esterase family protein [Pirellulaceae bacterium]
MAVMILLFGIVVQTDAAIADDWVSRHGVELGPDFELSDAAKDLISNEMRDVKVVGLGETSHGISEIFQMKSALIRFLVTEREFSLIMLEATFGEVVYLNEYISGERDDIDAILKGMPLWYFKVAEFRDLLDWLREFNATHDNRVQLFGMEMQYVDRSLQQIKAYLDTVDPVSTSVWDAFGMDRIGSATASAKEFFYLWQPMSDDALREHVNLLVELRNAFDENKSDYVSKSSAAEYDLMRRHLVVLEQFVSAAMQSDERIKHQMRDYFMFLNVQWTRSYCESPKTIVWAHNEHVWKQHGNGGYDVLGRQLDKAYGESYFALGFDFGEGTYRAPGEDGWLHDVPKPVDGSLTSHMSRLGSPNYLLNIRSGLRANEPIPDTVTMRASSGGYTPMRNGQIYYDRNYSLTDRYDALIFLNRASPPTMLD